MNANPNAKRILRGTAALVVFGLLAIIALHFLPTISLPQSAASSSGKTLAGAIFGSGSGVGQPGVPSDAGSTNATSGPSTGQQGGSTNSSSSTGLGGQSGSQSNTGSSNATSGSSAGQQQNGVSIGGFSSPSVVAMAGPITLDYTKVLEIESPSPHYWRMSSYDTFDGTSWSNSSSNTTDVGCGQPFGSLLPESTQLTITVQVLNAEADQELVGPLSPDGACPANNSQVIFDSNSLSLRASEPIPVGETYQVESAVTDFSPQELRAAGDDFPADVLASDLQLPANSTARIATLAAQVTAGADTEYDKAEAIEAYLRNSGKYTYTLTPPVTPAGQNGVDFFLFDSKEGYCSYFASAMAVMLRSIGIPARVAAGFAPGPWDELTHSVVLENAQAHAWTEVYFPGLGWVEFDATAPGDAAQPELTSSESSGTNGASLASEITAPVASLLPKPQVTQQPTPPAPQKVPTQTVITAFPSSFYRGTQNIVTGNVSVVNGGLVANASVALYLAESTTSQGTEIGEGQTDANGVFNVSVSVDPSFDLGSYQLIARYAGDNTHLPSNSDPQITVRAHSNLTLSVATSSNEANVSGVLTDDSGKPITNVQITLALDGEPVNGVQTDGSGSFTSLLPASPGTHTVVANFAGTNVYNQVQKSATFSISLPKASSAQNSVEVPVKTPTPAAPPIATATESTSTSPPPPAPENTSTWPWVVGSIVLVGILTAGGYWYYRKYRANGTVSGDAVSLGGELLLDIRFPQVDSDLPLIWGTTDPPLEAMAVYPKRLKVSLTVNGKEQQMPNTKGEYVFELKCGDQRVAKTVRVVRYGEEIEKDLETLRQKYNLDATKLTAREIIAHAKEKQPIHKRLNLLLSLFEKYAYGKREILRDEYVAYYRSV